MTTYPAPRFGGGIDGMTLAAFLLIIFGALMVYRDISAHNEMGLSGGKSDEIQDAQSEAKPQKVNSQVGSGQAPPGTTDMEGRVASPYMEYTLTQGLHGFSYGHSAVDLSAGMGAIIRSPIQGYVSDLYTDQYGNPTLVLENEGYRVTMLHGKFKVAEGEQVALGQMLGRESNLGLTTDMQGRSCRNRACGYHTHLNIFDKQLGENVNPLEVME